MSETPTVAGPVDRDTLSSRDTDRRNDAAPPEGYQVPVTSITTTVYALTQRVSPRKTEVLGRYTDEQVLLTANHLLRSQLADDEDAQAVVGAKYIVTEEIVTANLAQYQQYQTYSAENKRKEVATSILSGLSPEQVAALAAHFNQ